MISGQQLISEIHRVPVGTSRFRRAIEARLAAGCFCCPVCHHRAIELDDQALRCRNCGSAYAMLDGILSAMSLAENDPKKAIQTFWDELYQAAYADDNAKLSREQLINLLPNLEAMFRARRHLAVVEMPLSRLKGAEVLEIGCGNGAHSAMFSYMFGARMTSVDITASRVLATSRKLDLLSPEGEHLCMQADAESLPFSEATFDVVYSNGVLHHTSNTEKAIDEVHRVLRPGGQAVIMLYARHSFQYWISSVIGHGVLKAQLLRGRSWLGRSTEWMAPAPQKVFNPITRVYSERGIRKLFRNFAKVEIRKNSFQWRLIPGLEPLLERTLLRAAPKFEGGRLVYGVPFRAESSVELWLGRHIGFGLNIIAKK